MKAGDTIKAQVYLDEWGGMPTLTTIKIISVTLDEVTYEIFGKRCTMPRATFEYQYGKVTP